MKPSSNCCRTQGARWAARRDVINRAIFGAVQVIEVIGDPAGGSRSKQVSTNSISICAMRYAGAPLLIPDKRPTPREILTSDEGERLLAGYLLRQSADRIAARGTGDRAEVYLHYDH